MDRKSKGESADASGSVKQSERTVDKAHDIFATADALDTMVVAARARLARAPDDERALWSLGELLRMQGSLDEALDCYRGVLRVKPGHPGARQLAAILGQDVLPERSGDNHAVPFVHEMAFLSEDEQSAVWDALRDGMAKMQKSGVGRGESDEGGGIDKEVRSSHVLYARQLKSIADWFRKRVVSELEHCWGCIGVEPFAVGKHELQLTIHRRGDFFRMHKDSGGNVSEAASRRVTFVYYCHRQPKRFKRGDMWLYDTDRERDRALGKYTRLKPLNNSLLLFPSECFHQVMPVGCETEEVEDGRLTLNGWIHPLQEESEEKAQDVAGKNHAPGA